MSTPMPGFVPLVVLVPPDTLDRLRQVTADVDTGLLTDRAAAHGCTADMLVAGWLLHQTLQLETKDATT